MRALRQKASSERGASITFALLLFLVCAIISSIVIVAATAVGGRASKMAEMDQRYYAVNSAAELVRDVLEETEVTVETGSRTQSVVDQSRSQVAGTTASTTALPAEVKVNGTALIAIDDSLVTTAALNLAEGVVDKPALPASMNLTATGSVDTFGLAVTMMPKIEDEILKIDISNTGGGSGGSIYALRLTFKADKTVTRDTQTVYGAKTPERDGNGKAIDGQYRMNKTETAKATTTLRWKLIDLVTVTAGA